MFEGFADEMVDLGDVRLRVRLGGEGPAVLLIHGHPRTSATWHRVAPESDDRRLHRGLPGHAWAMAGRASRSSEMITASRPNAWSPMILPTDVAAGL